MKFVFCQIKDPLLADLEDKEKAAEDEDEDDEEGGKKTLCHCISVYVTDHNLHSKSLSERCTNLLCCLT